MPCNCCCHGSLSNFNGEDYDLWARYMKAFLRTKENRIDTEYGWILDDAQEDRIFMLFYHSIDHKILRNYSNNLRAYELWKALENEYCIVPENEFESYDETD